MQYSHKFNYRYVFHQRLTDGYVPYAKSTFILYLVDVAIGQSRDYRGEFDILKVFTSLTQALFDILKVFTSLNQALVVN